MSFTNKDKDNVVKFLNFIALKAEFNKLSVSETVQFYHLLNYFQTELLKKIDDHLMEVIQTKEIKPIEQIKEKKK